MRLVHGVGVNDGSRPIKTNNKITKEYSLWHNMISRCYSKKVHNIRETYKECIVCENFKSYSYFYDWCQNQIGFHEDGFDLDKDLLEKGNKIYSEITCVFIPSEINKKILRKSSSRGEYPIGVHFDKKANKFKSQLWMDGKRSHLGYFDTPVDAFNMYKKHKESQLKLIAEYNKLNIDFRAYQALINYSVDIDD